VTYGGLKKTFQTTTLPVFWIKIEAEYPDIAKKALKPSFKDRMLEMEAGFLQ